MERIEDFENVKAFEDFTALPGGGYVMVIKSVSEGVNHKGTPVLTVLCDVAEGEFKNYAGNNEKALRKMEAYHSKASAGLFKRFINAVEESNRGFKWNWDENKLVGKVFGVVVYNEEYLTQDGEKRIASKIEYKTTTSVEKIRKGDFKPIPMKKLDPSNIPSQNEYFGETVDNVDTPF